jgi:hypothetical protein
MIAVVDASSTRGVSVDGTSSNIGTSASASSIAAALG